MTSKEKIEYMLHEIREAARISPSRGVHVSIQPVLDVEANGGVPDGAPVLFSVDEQVSVLEKFEAKDLIDLVIFDDDRRGAAMLLYKLDIDSDDNPFEKSSNLPRGNKKALTTNLKRGVLVINGKSISISTSAGKENYPLQLLRTLVKDPEKDWFKDEILGDWEGKDAIEIDERDYPRKRVYAAARALNIKIQEQADIKDFVIFGISKFHINPQYLDDLKL